MSTLVGVLLHWYGLLNATASYCTTGQCRLSTVASCYITGRSVAGCALAGLLPWQAVAPLGRGGVGAVA